MNFLIPYPTSTENIAAIVKPFDYQVNFKFILLYIKAMSL